MASALKQWSHAVFLEGEGHQSSRREVMMFGCGVCKICNKLRHFPLQDLKFGYASVAKQQLKVCSILSALEQGLYVYSVLLIQVSVTGNRPSRIMNCQAVNCKTSDSRFILRWRFGHIQLTRLMRITQEIIFLTVVALLDIYRR